MENSQITQPLHHENKGRQIPEIFALQSCQFTVRYVRSFNFELRPTLSLSNVPRTSVGLHCKLARKVGSPNT